MIDRKQHAIRYVYIYIFLLKNMILGLCFTLFNKCAMNMDIVTFK